MSERSPFKSIPAQVITGVIVTLIVGAITGEHTNWFGFLKLSKEDQKKEALNTIRKYANGLNKKTFKAENYFADNVERFFMMLNTKPGDINKYVNGDFYKDFVNPTVSFDESSLVIHPINEDGFKVSILMYGTYYQRKEKKQYNNLRTRCEIKMDKNFRIYYLRQFFE